mgnify:CR=1 FL=1
MDERLQKTISAIREIGADWAVLTSPDAVAYATGHVVPVEAGPSPFAGGPTTAIIGTDGTTAIVAANVEGASAKASRANAVELYEGFTFETGPDLVANYGGCLNALRARLGVSGRIAIEEASFPHVAAELFKAPRYVSITGALNRARAIKTAEELQAMRQAARTAAAGQKAFMQNARAGISELDLFAEIRAAMENFAGERLPVTGDFLSGVSRTAGFTGWPIARRLEDGDPLMSDLAPRVAGYWGDSCASAMLGHASRPYLRLFEAAKSALTLAGEIMRPGLAIAELDRRLREHVARSGYAYPHHSGHSLGTSVHEWPRIVPYEAASLAPGMVLMIEPGAYDPEIGGVRTEWMFEITDGGCRVLTEFEHVPETAA